MTLSFRRDLALLVLSVSAKYPLLAFILDCRRGRDFDLSQPRRGKMAQIPAPT
jgi:hypothetical protein